MEVAKQKNPTQKPTELEDDKPDYQEKITFLVSTIAQAFILTWCLLVLSYFENKKRAVLNLPLI